MKTTSSEEFKHRLAMIMDDIRVIESNLGEEILSKPTSYSDCLGVHFSNIEIACDLESEECLSWSPFFKGNKVIGADHHQVERIIRILKNDVEVDGETIQYIVEKVGMEEQLLKQLIATYPEFIEDENPEEENLKTFWRDVRNTSFEHKELAKRVWDDIMNNGHIGYNDFDSYYKARANQFNLTTPPKQKVSDREYRIVTITPMMTEVLFEDYTTTLGNIAKEGNETAYALQEIIDSVMDTAIGCSLYFQPNRDNKQSKGIITRIK